jgi:hypothetical protein
LSNRARDAPGVAVFGSATPRPLRGLPTVELDGVTAQRRIIVTGAAADLAAVLTALLRADRLDVEVAHATGHISARRALGAPARRVPLIRDETGSVIVAAAQWRGADGRELHGEAVVDDHLLFDGEVPGVRVEPTLTMPGLRAAVLTDRGRVRTWVTGRAAQLGTTGAQVTRDGVLVPRKVRRSTFYRHTEGWLRVG